jgi:hypothetical protein
MPQREPTAKRLACLEWLLKHGADPEQLGAWPRLERSSLPPSWASPST